MNGYAGQILRVDLSKQNVSSEILEPILLKTYVGGAALGGKLLCDEVSPQADAYSPENKVVLMTGPLTGTEIPGAVVLSLVTRSPCGGLPVVTNANGTLGRKLKFAGFDGAVFEGASERWCYLLVEDGRAELLDASELLDKDTYETDEALKGKHGASAIVGCIGPAGERLVRFSGFIAEKEHSASKGGTGAVLGSKKLKAIVVKSRNKSISIFDEDLMAEVLHKWRIIDTSQGPGVVVSKRGMRGLYESNYTRGIVPVRNLTQNDFPEHEKFNYEAVSQHFQIYRNSCPTCTFNHFNRFLLEGEDLKEPHFDMLVGYGPNIGISDPVQAVKLTTLVDRLGLETQEMSWLLSLLMECYDEGLIGAEQLDGTELHWGDYENTVRLVEKVARRQGCGGRFAEGIYRTANWLGPVVMEKAVYAKRGFVPQLMDNRNSWAFSFAEAVSNIGHYEALTGNANFFSGGEREGVAVPPGLTAEELAAHHARSAPRTQIIDSLGICFLHGASGDIRFQTEALKAATGLELDVKQLFQVGLRFINLMRRYAVRCGHRAEDDTLSPRYLSTPSRGENAGKALADYIPEVRQEYYRLMGWDDEGVPLPETLRQLGIE